MTLTCKDCGAHREKGSRCLACHHRYSRERYAAYYAKHSDEVCERRRIRYAANPEPEIARTKRWQKENPDRIRDLVRLRYWRNVDAMRERSRLSMRATRARRKSQQQGSSHRLYEQPSWNEAGCFVKAR